MASPSTDTARTLLAEGKLEAAVETLWAAEAGSRGDPDELAELLELARAVKDNAATRKLGRDAATLVDSLTASLASAQAKPVMLTRPRFRDGMPVSTANEIPGWQVTGYIGEVFGLVVRARGAFPQFGANLKAVFGGELTTMTNLLRQTREDAVTRLVDEAQARGADAIIAMRFDVTSMGESTGWTEVCAYGTAVHATRLDQP